VAEVLTPDLCVVGAGSAGLSVAAIAASFGASVVLIERDRMGGDCLNVGCVPSKAVIAAAARAHAMRDAARFGLEPADPQADYARVREHVRGVIAAIAPNDSAERFSTMGVRVIAAEARFTDPRTVAAGGAMIRARRFVLATGSRPAAAPIPGLDGVPYLTNETVFDLERRPERLIVIGGGSIGVELAQAHRRLGAAVTVIEAATLLSREDPEMTGYVERALVSDGVEVRSGAAIESVGMRGERIVVLLKAGEAIEGSHLLVATGRTPTTGGLGLDGAGIAVERAGIVVDKGLRTTNRRVYAIGDCAGGPAAPYRLTHAANHQAGLVIRNALFRLPVDVTKAPMPRVTFTDPELAVVGVSEAEARAAGRAIRVLRWPFADNDRAQAERTAEGLVKAVVTRRGTVLGCAIAGPHAGELIAPWVLATARRQKVQHLAGIVFPYPTLSEVTKRAAVEFVRPSAQNAWVRRLVRVARAFG
jgi:pyruvate/2-oxoglutarate dehydrogenase complex dihydrolipoamide dehydrogenase (E3) component